MKIRLKAIVPIALGLVVASASGNAIAAGDAEKGERAYKRCAACHSLDQGKNKVGPSLHNIVGRKAGTVDGFNYSDSYTEAGEKGLEWQPDQLIAYLEDPKAYLAQYLGKDNVKSRMVNKFKKLDFREDVVAYLQSLQ